MTGSSPKGPAQIPLLIGVTGHRDLVVQEIGSLRAAVRRFLTRLLDQFPDAPLLIATSLCRGADLLVVEEALGLGIDCCAVLPLPPELYRADFGDADDWRRFEEALARCRQTIVCSGSEPATESGRTARYAAAGELIARNAFILLALWDGRPGGLVGGTGSIVEFRLSQQEWNPVYHIVTSRQGGTPVAGLTALQEGYRATVDGPLEAELPTRARPSTNPMPLLNGFPMGSLPPV
jgi:hypothetical protein